MEKLVFNSQIASFCEKNCRNNFSLGKIQDLRDENGHKYQTKHDRELKNGFQ